MQTHYTRISLYNNTRLDMRTISWLSLRSIEFFSEHRQMQSEFTPILLCICIFTLNFIRFFLVVVLYFYVTHAMVNAYNSLLNI